MRTKYLFVFSFIAVIWASGPVGAAVFDHAAHDTFIAEENVDCITCHTPGAASIVPENETCLNCHDQAHVDAVVLPSLKSHGPLWSLNHRQQAISGAIDCAQCHEQSSCLDCHKAGFADEQGSFSNALTNVHRSEFTVTHPLAARTDPQRCNSCHENQTCVDCHNSFNRADLAFDSHRRSWSDRSVSGTPHSQFSPEQCQTCHVDSVLPSHDWTSSHAREARKNLATCQACHPEGDVCLTCHSARTGLGINPHPRDWDKISDNLESASDRRTCRKCH